MLTRMMARMMVVGLIALGLTTRASAAIINLDINDTQDPDHGHVPPYPVENYSGAAVIGAGGDQWNYLNPPSQTPPSLTVSSLFESDGTPRTVSFTLLSSNYNNHRTATNALLNDYILTFVPGTFTISNLQPSGVYDLYLYSTAGAVGLGGRFTIGGDTETATGGWSISNYNLNENYVRYLGISADGSGNITGTFEVNPGSGIGTINGFQIQGEFALPEPASVSMLVITAGPLLLRRRR